jgi:hypothetical protein
MLSETRDMEDELENEPGRPVLSGQAGKKKSPSDLNKLHVCSIITSGWLA